MNTKIVIISDVYIFYYFYDFAAKSAKSAPQQVDKPASRSKPKKTPTTTTGRMVKKTKEKLAAGAQPARKKVSSPLTPTPEGVVTKKSKEMSNRLAEAKH